MSELPTGLMTEEETRPNVTYVSFNNKTKKLCWNKGNKVSVDIGGIKGTLLGFSSEIFKFEGEDIEKFNIWLQNQGAKIKVSFGMESYIAMGVMNTLLSIPCKEGEQIESKVLSIVGISKNDKASLYMNWGTEQLKWKYEWADLKMPSELTDAEKKGKSEKTQKELLQVKQNERKGQIIAKWFDALMKRKPYDPKTTMETIDEETGEVVSAAIEDDEIPF